MYKSLISNCIFCILLALPAFLIGCDSPSQQTSAAPVELDAEAPDFTLKNVAGEPVSLSDYRGQVVLLNFWATWCPPCKAEMPSMETLYRMLKDEGLVFLAVNAEPNGPEVVPAFLEKNPHSFPILLDDKGVVQKLYGVYKFPETFIIRRDGTIDDRVIGAIDWAHPEAVDYFKTLLKGSM